MSSEQPSLQPTAASMPEQPPLTQSYNPYPGDIPDPLFAAPQGPKSTAPPPLRPDDPPPQDPAILLPGYPYGPGFVAGAGSGWSAMAKIVREVDEEKVRDYKEDIDTILVFAGLFSAVMTAFLIESYQNLRQNSTDLMVALLQQMVVQTNTYSFNAGFLNSTTAPYNMTQTTFRPTTNAVRVNVLWFASLVLSLISASFGILVKQWLREYLAGEYTSAQARLRIRHFRNPGLSHWKVFEIAAALPVLLQLALALFFVGLCFFTADVHSSIGHTTLPLVIGWAFLFLAASLAPALSPRCPYKTTLLKSVMKWMRKRLYEGISHARKLTHHSAQMYVHISNKWSYHNLAYDEEHAAVTDKSDIDILVAVDSIQSDEHLLNVMWDALQQTQADPAETIGFLSKIIGHRLQRDMSYDDPSSFIDLRSLPKSTFTSVTTKVADVLGTEVTRQPRTAVTKAIDWSPWMRDCMYLLLSEGSFPLPDEVNKVFMSCLSGGRHKAVFDFLRSRYNDPSAFLHILQKMRGGFLLIEGDELLDVLQYLLQKYFCVDHDPATTHYNLREFIRDHAEIPSDDLQYLVSDILIDSLMSNFKPGHYWHSWRFTYFELIIQMSVGQSWREVVVKLVKSILLNAAINSVFYRYPMGLGKKDLPLQQASQALYIDAFLSSNALERRTILMNLDWIIAYQWGTHPEEADNTFDRFLRVDPLEACHMQLQFYQLMQERDEVPDYYLAGYLRDFWADLSAGLRIVSSRQYDGHPQLAKACLELIEALDPPPLTTTTQKEDGQTRLAGSPFPDDIVSTLMRFIPHTVVAGDTDAFAFSARARRVLAMRQNPMVYRASPPWQQSGDSVVPRYAPTPEPSTVSAPSVVAEPGPVSESEGGRR